MLSTPTPPTASSSVSAGNTARQALNTAGGMISAGNSFSPSAPAFSAAKPSDGVITPGSAARPAALAARTTSASKFGATIRLAAGVLHARDVRRFEHRAGADQRTRAVARGEPLDALERLRRIERHLDDRDAGLDQRIADRVDLVRLHAAQDRGDRALRQGGAQVEHRRFSTQAGGARNAPVAGRDAVLRRERAVVPEQAQRLGVALRERGARDDRHGAFRLPASPRRPRRRSAGR